MKKTITTIALNLLFTVFLLANSPVDIQYSFQWSPTPEMFSIGEERYELWRFEGAVIGDEHPSLPYFIRQFAIEGNGQLRVEVISASYEVFDRKPSPDDVVLSNRLDFETSIHKDRNGFFGHIAFVPIIRNGSTYERLTNVQLRITLIPGQISFRDPENTETSVLSDGELYKIAISETGMHKLTYNFLKNELDIAIDNVNPADIKIYGNGGGYLPYDVEAERIDDLVENHIRIVGGEDGSFDSGDYILLYAEGPDKWTLDASGGVFNMQKNIYDTRNYYFIKISSQNGQRAQDQSSAGGASYTSTAYDTYARLEDDKVNLLHEWQKAEGSGQNWYGDHFKVAREYSYNDVFNFQDLITQAPVKIKASMVLRATKRSSFNLEVNGQQLTSDEAEAVSTLSGTNDNIIEYAKRATLDAQLLLTSGNIDLKVNYPHPNGVSDQSEGWLDYIQINLRQRLQMRGNQLAFRDLETLNHSASSFQLANANGNIQVWDISNPLQPRQQQVALNGATLNFSVSTNTLREFVAFDPSSPLLSPEAIGAIENQNIHGIDEVDMVIIYHPEFESEAMRLAEHRNTYSDLDVALVRIDKLYNEFSSGKVDPSVIRDFSRMLYSRNDRFRYLMLFGDGSFDTRDIYGLGGDFVPIYERESLNPIFSFPADDYYAILEPSPDISDPLKGFLNISIGRLPVKTLSEAQAVVDKIINYDTNPNTMGDWRNRLVFVGDDEDGYLHTGDADYIANLIEDLYPNVNIEKLFLDAFPQVSTPGGNRFPSVNEALDRALFKGVLAVTYLGHGGPKGWAQERVLNISDVVSWENIDRLPLFVTATCSFTGFDDPSFVSAGEELFLNPKGGAIGLMTTTRAVYASSNADLTEAALKKLFERPDNRVQTLGESIRNAKNSFTSGSTVTNSRKFILVGDPAQVIAIPRYDVKTSKIDQHLVADGELDTLRALQKVTIEGAVVDANDAINESFNGVIFPTIFDKRVSVSTLGQDQGSPVREFQIQKNIIFKGRASVTNGRFQFTFVVPKDINYEFGRGKISYYAADEANMTDAAGSYDRIMIGGTDPNAQADDQGPLVEVFMNTEDFVFGGITDANPTLLVSLEDDNGINVVGNSIGHDLEGVLDNNTQNTYLLNDFYESELDDYTRGQVRYPLSDLAEGRHAIKVKAWDVANNASEGYTEFVVAASGEVALRHVLNYPNPFTDRTCFQFDHNLANQELEVMVQIFTVSGRLVKTLNEIIFSDGAIRQDDCIQWDGKDDYGDQLARGVYLYRVKVRSVNTGNTTLNGESEFEKLVILK